MLMSLSMNWFSSIVGVPVQVDFGYKSFREKNERYLINCYHVSHVFSELHNKL